MTKTFFTILILGIFSFGYGQNHDLKLDILKLKNGAAIKGEILELIQDSIVSFKLEDGQVLVFPTSEVRRYSYKRNKKAISPRIERSTTQEEKNLKAPKKVFEKKGNYKNLSLGFTAGNVGNDNFLLATYFQFHFGKYLNNKSAVGLGIGVENFNLAKGEMIYPLFVEGKYHFKNTISSPFVGLGAGYSLASGFLNDDIIKTEGGPMAQADLGFRIHSVSGAILELYLQYRYQEAYFERLEYYHDPFSFPPSGPVSSDIITYDYNYSRLNFCIGLLF